MANAATRSADLPSVLIDGMVVLCVAATVRMYEDIPEQSLEQS
jgi:hypothetical protein